MKRALVQSADPTVVTPGRNRRRRTSREGLRVPSLERQLDMIRRSLIAIGALAVGAACADVPTPPSESVQSSLAPGGALRSISGVPRVGHYIVVFQSHVSDTPERARALVAAHGGKLEFTYVHALHGFAAALSPAAI